MMTKRKSPRLKDVLCKKCSSPTQTRANIPVLCITCLNYKKPKKEKIYPSCVICSNPVLKPQRKTCSRECFSELNRRISVERYRNGEAKIITGNVGIKGHYYNGIYLRSSWELEFAKYLDSLNIIWKYEDTRFDLGDSIYIPDFHLIEMNAYIEIKGWAKPEFLAKMEKMDKLYPHANLLVIQRPPPYDWLFW